MWTLQITKTKNGYILQGDFDQNGTLQQYVVEESHPLAAEKKMLYDVLEYFGVCWSKHNDFNMSIKVVEKDDTSKLLEGI